MITRERWVKAQNSERSHIAFDSYPERNATVVIEQIFKDKLEILGVKIVVVGEVYIPRSVLLLSKWILYRSS